MTFNDENSTTYLAKLSRVPHVLLQIIQRGLILLQVRAGWVAAAACRAVRNVGGGIVGVVSLSLGSLFAISAEE